MKCIRSVTRNVDALLYFCNTL